MGLNEKENSCIGIKEVSMKTRGLWALDLERALLKGVIENEARVG